MKNVTLILTIIGLSLWVSACSTAANQNKNPKTQRMMMNKGKMGMMTPEMHEKMAEKHKKAAGCLRSGKSQKECMPMMGKGKMGMMKDMDMCMKQMKGKKMNQKGMGMMKKCVMQEKAKADSKEMSKEEHESHH